MSNQSLTHTLARVHQTTWDTVSDRQALVFSYRAYISYVVVRDILGSLLFSAVNVILSGLSLSPRRTQRGTASFALAACHMVIDRAYIARATSQSSRVGHDIGRGRVGHDIRGH